MRWYRRFFRREATEKQLNAELPFHLDQKIADLMAAGIAPEEARLPARHPPGQSPPLGASISLRPSVG